MSDGVLYYYRVCAESREAGVGLGEVLSFNIDGLSGLDQVFPSAVPIEGRDESVTVDLTYATAPPTGIVGGWRFLGLAAYSKPPDLQSNRPRKHSRAVACAKSKRVFPPHRPKSAKTPRWDDVK